VVTYYLPIFSFLRSSFILDNPTIFSLASKC